MIATLLVHAAIWTQFAASHAANYFDFHTAKQESSYDWGVSQNTSNGPVVEKVVIRETTLSEKYGLGVETESVRYTSQFHLETDARLNDQQKEIAAVRADARHVAPTTDWLAARKDIVSATPKIRAAVQTNWEKKFAARWDEDGGFWLGGKYFPNELDDKEIFSFFVSFAH